MAEIVLFYCIGKSVAIDVENNQRNWCEGTFSSFQFDFIVDAHNVMAQVDGVRLSSSQNLNEHSNGTQSGWGCAYQSTMQAILSATTSLATRNLLQFSPHSHLLECISNWIPSDCCWNARVITIKRQPNGISSASRRLTVLYSILLLPLHYYLYHHRLRWNAPSDFRQFRMLLTEVPLKFDSFWHGENRKYEFSFIGSLLFVLFSTRCTVNCCCSW